MDSNFPITKLPQRLNADFGGTVSYRKIYTAVLDGKIPATQGENGRYQVAEADLPVIAEALGLAAPAAA